MAKDKIKKTNATRILDKAKIEYQMHDYPVTPKAMSGLEVAEYLKRPSYQVFKTLVLKGNNTGYLVAIISSDHELDLKKLANVSNNKKVEMIAMADLKPNTGYVHGGCSPLGMKKVYPTYLSNTAYDQETIIVSAGEIGKQIEVNPIQLTKVLNAEFVDINN